MHLERDSAVDDRYIVPSVDTVLFDIDGVMVDTDGACYQVLSQMPEFQDGTTPLVNGRVDQGTHPILYAARQRLLQDGEWLRSLQPYPGAAEAVGRIARLGTGRGSTGRVMSVMGATLEWLHMHGFDQHLKQTDFKPDPSVDIVKSKEGTAIAHSARLTLEDDPGVIHAYSRNGIFTAAIRTASNAEVQDGWYTKVYPTITAAADDICQHGSFERYIFNHQAEYAISHAV